MSIGLIISKFKKVFNFCTRFLNPIMSKKIFLFFFILFFLISAVLIYYLWRKTKTPGSNVYYFVPPERSFLYSEEELRYGLERYLREAVEKEMEKLIKDKASFIYVDLKKMELNLYKEGEKFLSFPVLSKGADWFLGETPPGVYSVVFMSRLHFSRLTRVWMPYSIQYYGNYFIHGWPYDVKGRPLSSESPTGGCIRLKTEDAAIVFEFAKHGMPVLLFDEKILAALPAIGQINKNVAQPQLNSEYILVADLDTGEILLSKEPNSQINAGPATLAMLALVSSDSIDLEKRIIARSWMFSEVKEGIVIADRFYLGYELLKPLLLNSSQEAALVLTRFLTPQKFLELMNNKAVSIGMKNTTFVDINWKNQQNTTTLFDVARMMRYIKDYRKFILDIGENLQAEDDQKRKYLFSTQKMFFAGQPRFIFIGLVGSFDTNEDLRNINSWLENNFSLKKQNPK